MTAMDYQVADILKQLEDDGLAENTIVFFWGDHGRGLPRSKRFVYNSGLRVPLIVRWPGRIKPGTTNDELVCLFDLGPTALSLAGVSIPTHMHAQAILGPQKKAPRRFAFAHRDRMDEASDMSRSVMGEQYHYIRNFHPDRPYFQYIDYLEQMPTMKEWRRLYKDHMNALDPNYGKTLNPAQLLFMQPQKPPEELYDVKADPHEINNLANDPRHQATLKQMRAALDKWQKETKDLGGAPELELRERMRPGGVWQKVAAPTLSRSASDDAVKVKLSCATEGSSIAYTTDSGDRPHWLLYTGELTLTRGVTLRFKACRLGYLDSDEKKETL
jgi:uncharacterized sulfatase